MTVTEFKLARAGDVALVTIDNGEDWTKPTFFGQRALESLDRLLGELERGEFSAAVITGKPFFFAAGADITEFPRALPGMGRHTAAAAARRPGGGGQGDRLQSATSEPHAGRQGRRRAGDCRPPAGAGRVRRRVARLRTRARRTPARPSGAGLVECR